MTFTRNKQAIHDFIARTIVVRTDETRIFNDKEEYNTFLTLVKQKENEKNGRED